MNQFFSFDRFVLLVWKHWADNKKRYGLSVLAFFGMLILRFAFFMLVADGNDGFDDIEVMTFFFALFLTGTFYASQYFSDLGSRTKAGNFLLVPASIFEKLLCGLLYSVVLFTAVVTATYYVVDILMLQLLKEVMPMSVPGDANDLPNVFTVGFFLVREDLRVNALLFFLSIQSAFLLGSIYFKKYSFIKTIISGFVIYFLLFALTYFLYKPLFGGDGNGVTLPRWIEQLFGIVVMYVIAPLLWILTYYRLKQKQV